GPGNAAFDSGAVCRQRDIEWGIAMNFPGHGIELHRWRHRGADGRFGIDEAVTVEWCVAVPDLVHDPAGERRAIIHGTAELHPVRNEAAFRNENAAAPDVAGCVVNRAVVGGMLFSAADGKVQSLTPGKITGR